MASLQPTRRAQIAMLSSWFFIFTFIFWSRSSLFNMRPLPPPGPNTVKTLINFRVPATSGFTDSVRHQTDVAMRITKPLLLKEGKEKNMVYSPLSIHAVLSLLATGTKDPAQHQLLSFLKSKSTADLNSLASNLLPLVFADGSSSGGPLMSYANGLWVDKSLSIKRSFKQVVDNSYKAPVNQVDFKTKAEDVRIEVNAWAEKETKGLIKEMLLPNVVDSSTRLIFANALYFKGGWDEKFDASRTKEEDFHVLNGNSVQAHFMTSKKKQFVRAFEGFKVLKLPYKQGEDMAPRFSMYLILPDAKDGLPALIEKVSSESGFIDGHLPHSKVEVGDFKIPRFKFSSIFEASKILKDLGLVLPFTSNSTDMVDSPSGEDLSVSKILHKSCIEVNEEGTEAAAVTTMILLGSARFDPEKIDFVVDHPFMFLIREEITQTLLFIGHVLNPLAG